VLTWQRVSSAGVVPRSRGCGWHGSANVSGISERIGETAAGAEV
jgi:hypothetical protein